MFVLHKMIIIIYICLLCKSCAYLYAMKGNNDW